LPFAVCRLPSPSTATPALAPTSRDVARIPGVSHSTVSWVLQNRRNIEESTRQRVFRALEETSCASPGDRLADSLACGAGDQRDAAVHAYTDASFAHSVRVVIHDPTPPNPLNEYIYLAATPRPEVPSPSAVSAAVRQRDELKRTPSDGDLESYVGPLSYLMTDFDQHSYEAPDAFTRFMTKPKLHAAVRPVKVSGYDRKVPLANDRIVTALENALGQA